MVINSQKAILKKLLSEKSVVSKNSSQDASFIFSCYCLRSGYWVQHLIRLVFSHLCCKLDDFLGIVCFELVKLIDGVLWSWNGGGLKTLCSCNCF